MSRPEIADPYLDGKRRRRGKTNYNNEQLVQNIFYQTTKKKKKHPTLRCLNGVSGWKILQMLLFPIPLDVVG